MDIQELLGTDYKEGMSDTEILDVLKTRKLADLSTGKYVNKDMATAKENQLNEQLRDLQSQLDSKLTDDEKRQKDLDSKDKEIAKLKETIKQSTLATNKAQLMANVADTLDKLEVKNDDKELNEFLDLITLEDNVQSSKVSSYLGKILKLAYQKGQEAQTKEQIASASDFQAGTETKEPMNIGERLAKQKQSYKFE